MIAWLDGVLTDSPMLPADDPAALLGMGVFETLAVRGGTPLALTRHLARLADSARVLQMPGPDDAVARDAVAALIGAPGTPSPARLRLTWTGGGHLLVTVAPLPPWPPTADAVAAPWPRDDASPIAAAKTTSYAVNALARQHAAAHGASEAIFLTRTGMVAEGAASNVVVAVGGQLLTPPLSAGVLPGITRGLLLDLGLVAEGDITRAQLQEAPEAFLSSSTRDVHPLASFDGRRLPAAPGPLTAAADRALQRLFDKDPDPR